MTASRRSVLVGIAATPIAPAILASNDEGGADNELMVLCQNAIVTARYINSNANELTNEELTSLTRRQVDILKDATRMPARTLAGWRAKAQLAREEIVILDGEPDDAIVHLMMSLVTDLVEAEAPPSSLARA